MALPRPQFQLKRVGVAHVMVPLDWLERVAQINGKTLHVAACLLWLVQLRRGPDVRLGQSVLRRFNASRDASYDALKKMAAAGLVKVDRSPGRSPVVTLLARDGRPLDVR